MTESELNKKLDAVVAHLEDELAKIRTGRASPALLDSVKVDAYGSMLSIREVGNITSLDSQTLQISTWDKKLKEAVFTAIRNSDLGLNPAITGENIIVPIPTLTEERRKEFGKIVSQRVEEAKQSIRNIRQERMKAIDKDFEAKQFGEDEKFGLKEDTEQKIKDFNTKVEDMGEAKKKELLTV